MAGMGAAPEAVMMMAGREGGVTMTGVTATEGTARTAAAGVPRITDRTASESRRREIGSRFSIPTVTAKLSSADDFA
jgi:hypothetical protein